VCLGVIYIFVRIKSKGNGNGQRTKKRQFTGNFGHCAYCFGRGLVVAKTGPVFEMIGIQLKYFFIPFKHLFMNWGNFLFSWQMVLIIVGLVLLAGKRSFGIVLIVLGGLFLAPKILFFPHITLSFILPAILIGAGIALIAKFI
jgi:hypothetical protein